MPPLSLSRPDLSYIRPRWFGETWGAPCCHPDEHIETPVGIRCAHCSRPFVAGDQGVVLTLIASLDDSRTGMQTMPLAYHCGCSVAVLEAGKDSDRLVEFGRVRGYWPVTP
jgi:hypothetical protein